MRREIKRVGCNQRGVAGKQIKLPHIRGAHERGRMDIYSIAIISGAVWFALALLTALAVGPVFAFGQTGGELGEDAGDGAGQVFHADNVRLQRGE